MKTTNTGAEGILSLMKGKMMVRNENFIHTNVWRIQTKETNEQPHR